MKTDLDRLMQEREIDVLLILPGETEDPYRTYLSNGVRSSGMVIKVRGAAPVLIVNGMERDEAARSGLTVYTDDDMGLSALMAQYTSDRDRVLTEYFRGIFERLGVHGKVALYGVNDINNTLRVVRMIEQHFADQVELVSERPRFTIFDRAYETKDAGELALLRDVGSPDQRGNARRAGVDWRSPRGRRRGRERRQLTPDDWRSQTLRARAVVRTGSRGSGRHDLRAGA